MIRIQLSRHFASDAYNIANRLFQPPGMAGRYSTEHEQWYYFL